MKDFNYRFKKLLESTLGNVKPLLIEAETSQATPGNQPMVGGISAGLQNLKTIPTSVTKEFSSVKSGDTPNKELSIQICKTRFPYIDSITDKEIQNKICSWGQSPAGKYLLSQPEDSREKVLDDLDKRNGDEETRKIKKEIRQALGMKADTLLGRMFSKDPKNNSQQTTNQTSDNTKINFSADTTKNFDKSAVQNTISKYFSDPKNLENFKNNLNQTK